MHYLDYNEKREHKTKDFPLAYYHIDEFHPRYCMPFHWHQESEILYVSSGTLKIYLDEREYNLAAGDVLYISGGILHGAQPTNCVYECVVYDLDSLLMNTPGIRRYLRLVRNKNVIIREHFSPDYSLIKDCVSKLFQEAYENSTGWELSILGRVLEFYGIIFRDESYETNHTKIEAQDKIQQIKPVLEYIESHYQNAITLSELAHIAGMTPKYFCRFFHAIIHKTPIDYLNYYRIERACYLLETSSISMTDVAYQCGFNGSSYFIKCFKKYKKITPKQYITAKRGM